MGISILGIKNGKTKIIGLEKLKVVFHEFDFIWVNAQNTSLKEMKGVSKIFNFHNLSVESALAQDNHARVEEFDGYVFFNVFEVSFEEKILSTKKLSFFLGKDFIVTVNKNGFEALKKVSHDYETTPELYKKGPVFLLYHIFDELIDSYFPQLDKVAEDIDKLENEVFSTAKKQTLNKLFRLKRKIIAFRRIVNPQREVVAHLSRHENSFIPKKYLIYFNDLHSHMFRVSDVTDTYRELISDTMEAYLTVVSNRLNEIMKVLTIIATIMLPLTLVTGFYGMNVNFAEYGFFGEGGTYFFALGLMIVIAVTMVLWFKNKKWI